MLFYLMSDSAAQGVFELEPLCVFHKRQLHLVRFGTERRAQVAFDYLERRGEAAERRAGSTGGGDHPVELHADRLLPRRAWSRFSRTPSSRSARTAACRWRAPASFPSSAGWICA